MCYEPLANKRILTVLGRERFSEICIKGRCIMQRPLLYCDKAKVYGAWLVPVDFLLYNEFINQEYNL